MSQNHRDIAILCSGPSLAAFLEAPPEHEVTIGVNRAVEVYPCDYWAFNDKEVFTRFTPVQRSGAAEGPAPAQPDPPPRSGPTCFTSNQAFKLIEPRDHVDEFSWLFYAQTGTSCPASPGYAHFTLTCALVLAEYLTRNTLSDKRVTLYGVDWKGEKDFDGASPTPVHRTGYRWNNEKHKFDHVARWLTDARGLSLCWGAGTARGSPREELV